jgi:HD-like signal output (HDOD) protein
MAVAAKSRLDELVRSISDVGTLPHVARKATQLASATSDANAQELAEVISNDAALSAKILKTVNSAFFGLRRKETNVRGAVVKLGFRKVHQLVMSLSVIRSFGEERTVDVYSRSGLRDHCMAVGVFSRILCTRVHRRTQRALAEDAFFAGLLHDFGILLEDQNVPNRFAELPSMASALRTGLYQVERSTLGFTHPELGAAVAKRWAFPRVFQAAIAEHHNVKGFLDHVTEDAGCLMAALIYLSEGLAAVKKVGYADTVGVDRAGFGRVAAALELSRQDFTHVSGEFAEQFEAARALFQ